MSLHKTLASIALILGLGAALIGSPTPDNTRLANIARMIESEQDHITPMELAVSLKEGRNNSRIIDLRDSASYQRYHIPGAELMSMPDLLNGGVKQNKHIVLYSPGGTHASQAWVLLKMKHIDSVVTLIGGMTGWEDEILYPVLNADTLGREMFEQKKALSIYFGGTPRTISQTSPAAIEKKQMAPRRQPQQPLKKQEEKLRRMC